tara:strand:+ start:1731 stop:2966 length:1236 start_codon:yes stop_codon:yes gene_type:complete
MGGRRRARNPVALPMRLLASEATAYGAAIATAEKHGTDADRAEATLIQQQLELHASYVRVCEAIEAFSDEMRASGVHLVPMRFPIRLTPRTRECVQDGMFRSFLRFLEDLHAAVLSQHKGEVDDLVTDVNTFLVKLANALTLESCRVLDGKASAAEARNVCISYIEKCCLSAVRLESTALLELDEACAVIIDCLKRFGMKASTIRKSKATRMRAFLCTAHRKGLRIAARQLQAVRQTRILLEKHGWLNGGEFDDSRAECVYDLLEMTHGELAQGLMWQQRRVAWLASANAAHRCWCGLALATGVVEGALVQAPAHMRSLACSERLHIVHEMEEVEFGCFLSVVGVANLTVKMLRERYLPLNRIGATYAERILAFDFCKYERAARNILEDTVRPWHARQCVQGQMASSLLSQ